LIFIFTGLPVANAANYTVTYNSNASQHQAGVVAGTVPNPGALPQGTINLATNSGNLTRQGFTFAGWNTLSTGLGTNYLPGASYNLTGNVTLYAKWDIPLSARLIGSGGSIVTVTNPNSIANGSICITNGQTKGITSDGTNIFFRPAGNLGYICKVSPIGYVISVNNVGGALATLPGDSLDLTYAAGCIFVRYDGTAREQIYCIDISDWSITSRNLPSGKGLLAGGGWLTGNLIDFPDGRMGAVSAPNYSLTPGTGAGQCPSLMSCKVLRLYRPTGTGKAVTFTFSEDIVLADEESGWPDDEHGIATDGTYLYEIKFSEGYKVYALQSGAPSYVVFDASKSGTCGANSGTSQTLCPINNPLTGATGALSNATYMGRIHGTNQYLIGDYTTAQFYISDNVAPPAGPGNPDVLAPGYTSTDTFTVTENIATSFNAATIIVNESSTMTISSGVDRLLFEIIQFDTASAYIRFKASPDFEGPTDSGGNNVYNITISATDLAGNIGIRAININVTNLSESSSTSPPAVSGNVYKGVITSLSVTVNAPGKVRFFMDGKRIASCLAVSTIGSYPNYTASCNWKPAVTARHTVYATLSPSDNSFTSSTSQLGSFWVLKRNTLR
jgi:uncharacterized repeat protein (TIGR02543 family)